MRLQLIRRHHAEALFGAAQDVVIWEWMSLNLFHRATLDRWIEESLAGEAQGRNYAFLVRDKRSGIVVGSTRYLNYPLR